MSAPTAVGALDADVVVQREGFHVQATLNVAAGGRLAILGPNGSGKSTLLNALAGLVPLAAGQVRFDGRVLERAGGPRTRPEHRRIALLDQKPRLFPHLSVAQNIAFAPRARGMARADALRAAEVWLDRLGLSGRGGDRPHRLSGGQQQRVAIARALTAEPELVLLDEPFAALDAESAPLVRRMLAEELTERGVSSILVTHDLADAWQLADHCIVLGHGRVLQHATPAELVSAPGIRSPRASPAIPWCGASGQARPSPWRTVRICRPSRRASSLQERPLSRCSLLARSSSRRTARTRCGWIR